MLDYDKYKGQECKEDTICLMFNELLVPMKIFRLLRKSMNRLLL